MEDIILIGCGGHAKSVVDSIESAGKYNIVGFLDYKAEKYKQYEVIGKDEKLEELFLSGIKNAFVTIGYMGKSMLRNDIYDKLKKIGFSIPSIVDSSAILASDVQISEGVYIGKGAIVNSNAVIDKMSIVNTGAIVEHDCKVGSFSHVAVGSVLCGAVSIGKNVLIGANATILQERSIGDFSIIGAGVTVRKSIKENITFCGR